MPSIKQLNASCLPIIGVRKAASRLCATSSNLYSGSNALYNASIAIAGYPTENKQGRPRRENGLICEYYKYFILLLHLLVKVRVKVANRFNTLK